MSATALFITGLTTGAVAGGASCAAVQGGLLAGAMGRRRAAREATPLDPAATAERGSRDRRRTAGAGDTTTLEPPTTPTSTPAPAPDSAAASLGAFLGAKLVSHTILGALLGAVGAAAEPSPRTRAFLLLAAAGIMVLFALDLIGVRAVRGLVPRAPESWTRKVRRSTRSGSVFVPAVLGFLTVLLPCGVTISMSLLAITSGSPAAGAAVMAGFVVGTAPLFAVLGFVLRQSTRIWQGRLSMVTGVVVLAVAAWTVNSALNLGGWKPGKDGGTISASASATAVRTLPNGSQVVTIDVRSTSYFPSALVAQAGLPTQLVLRTQDTGGCTRAFVIPGRNIQKVLPATGATTVELGTPQAGTMRYTCGMGMYTGRVEFRSGGATTPGGVA